MNDTTLVFIEACSECGRVTRVNSKARARKKAPVLCTDCSANRVRRRSSTEGG
jgi:hypothetical protein